MIRIMRILNRLLSYSCTGFRSFARDGRLRCHRLGSSTDLPPQNYGTWCPWGPTYPPRITEYGARNQRKYIENQVK
jgi:hypothetical protein